MSTVTKEALPNNQVAILTGPSHAEELARGIPTTIVVASDDREVSYYVQNTLANSSFRIYVNDDVLGCELGGSLKNVIALAAGVCDGLGLGDNTKAALMTRGIREISELGVAMGAEQSTFGGLSGIGDLIVTCCSMHSRNRRAGILIGQGVSPDEAVERVGTVEGYICTKNAHELAEKLNVEMPITEQLYAILYNGQNPQDSIIALMDRPKKRETEKDFLGDK
jgi:glycerol-3-phosphate dehydrogenase (NAD(P)+)